MAITPPLCPHDLRVPPHRLWYRSHYCVTFVMAKCGKSPLVSGYWTLEGKNCDAHPNSFLWCCWSHHWAHLRQFIVGIASRKLRSRRLRLLPLTTALTACLR